MEQRRRSWAGAGAGAVGEHLAAHAGLVGLVVRRQPRGQLPFADALHAGCRAVAQAESGPVVRPGVGAEPGWWAAPAEGLHRAAVCAAVRALVAELPRRSIPN